MGERTGSRVFFNLWPYVTVKPPQGLTLEVKIQDQPKNLVLLLEFGDGEKALPVAPEPRGADVAPGSRD